MRGRRTIARTIEKDLRKIERIAYHEAGHAIAWYLSGYGARVWIDFSDPQTIRGHTEVAYLDPHAAVRDDRWLRASVRAALAGQAAEARFTGLTRPPMSAADRQGLEDSAALLYPGKRDRLAYIRQQREAVQAMMANPAYWSAVEALATELLAEPGEEYLSDGMVRDIITAALVRHETEQPWKSDPGIMSARLDYYFRRLTHHEAGHAIAAAALGLAVERVSVFPEDISAGRTLLAPGQSVSNSRDMAIVLLAGPLAEQRACGHFDAEGAEMDLNFTGMIVRDALLDGPPSDEAEDRAWDDLIATTQRLLDRYWPAIAALADELPKGIMSGDRVVQILADHTPKRVTLRV